MAQVLKFQSGGPTASIDTLNGYKINNINPTQYFQVGPTAYDLNKFKDVVWHNFDKWIEHNNYNSSVKDKSRKFINEVLESLTSGDAEFNPDLTLTVKDNKGGWDPTVGFNKTGPKLFHWITLDKVDDQRGIPHVSMRYLVEILNSPVMQKYEKPELTNLSDLTKKVFDKVVLRDFGGSWINFRNNWGKRSSFDKVSIFRDALKDFKNSTDFSIYTDSSVRELGKKIDDFIKYLDTNPTLDQKLIDKASSLSFYGLDEWMLYKQPLKEQNDDSGGNNNNNSGYGNNSGYSEVLPTTPQTPLSEGTRELALKDINELIAPFVKSQIDFYNNNNNIGFFKNLLKLGSYSLTGKKIDNIKDIMLGSSYIYWLRSTFPNDENRALLYINTTSRHINRFLMGKASMFNRDTILDGMKIVLNKASVKDELQPWIMEDVYYLSNSYDPETLTYLAVDLRDNVKTIMVIPAAFVPSNLMWLQLKLKVDNYLSTHLDGAGSYRQYSPEEIYSLGLMSYFNGKSAAGLLKEYLDNFNWIKYPKHKKGGILKALTGLLIYANKLDTAQALEPSLNNYYITPELVRQEREAKRLAIINEREAKRNKYINDTLVKNEKEKIGPAVLEEIERLDFIDKLTAEINSLSDLVKNFTDNDAWVITTLLSDIVALGGSLAGGIYNPVADAATVASMVGTIGTVATDKSMNIWQKVGYGATNLILDAVSLVPEIGAMAKTAKIGSLSKKGLKLLVNTLKWGSVGLAGKNAVGPLLKLYNGDSLTKEDWTHLAYFALALLTGTLAGRSIRGGGKYTKEVKPFTDYQIKTNKGWKSVNKNVYTKYGGESLKVLKETKNADKPLFTTITGEKIYIKDLPRANKAGIGAKTVQAKAKEVNGGYRLMTEKEVSSSLGFKPITVNGTTFYPVPRSYSRIAYRMNSEFNTALRNILVSNPFKAKVTMPLINSKGSVVLNNRGEPVMVKVSQRKAREMSLTYEKFNRPRENANASEQNGGNPAGTTREEVKTGNAGGDNGNGAGGTGGTPPPSNPGAGGQQGSPGTPKLSGNEGIISKVPTNKRANITPEIKKSLLDNLAALGNTDKVRNKLISLLKKSGYSKPLPKIEKNHLYYFNNKSKEYVSVSIKNLKTKLDLSRKLAMLNKKFKGDFIKKGVKFLTGGIFPELKLEYKPISTTLPLFNTTLKYPTYESWEERLKKLNLESLQKMSIFHPKEFKLGTSYTYSGEKENNKKEGFLMRTLRGAAKYTRPHHLFAIGLYALAALEAKDAERLKNEATVPALEATNNNLIYQPTFAVQRDFGVQRLLAENSRKTAQALSGNIRDYYGAQFAENLTNNSLAAQNMSEQAKEFLTTQGTNATNAKDMLDKLVTTGNTNLAKVLLANASKKMNAVERNLKIKQGLATLADMYLKEWASRDEARNLLGQYAYKKYYETFSDEYRDYSNALQEQKVAEKNARNKYNEMLAENNNLQFKEIEFQKWWKQQPEYLAAKKKVEAFKGKFDINWFTLLMDGTDPGYYFKFLNDLQNKLSYIDYEDPYKRLGGTLSYEQRMSLKLQDAINKMITTDKKERSSVRKELIREYNKNARLISKRSETLLKAALGVK